MSWYVISHNCNYLNMLYITELTTFPCQFHYNELSSDLRPQAFSSLDIYRQLLFYSDSFAKNEIHRKDLTKYS